MRRRDLAAGAVIALPAGIAALPALAVPAQAAPPAIDPDAELLALCARRQSVMRRTDHLMALMWEAEEAGDKALTNRLFDMQRRFVPYSLELERQLFSIPAKTRAGMAAKALIAASHVTVWVSGGVSESDMPLWSLCCDLLGNDPGKHWA
jgi:hypothetical protein